MSGAPIIIGIIQFANPTKAGMIAPNTMTSACMVVIWLKNSGVDELQSRPEELRPDHEREGAADEQHQEREHEVQRPDVLVVRGEDPPGDSLIGTVVVVLVGLGVGRGAHGISVSLRWRAPSC